MEVGIKRSACQIELRRYRTALVEQDDPISEVHLSDLDTDPGEELNLSDVEPAVTAELRQLAEDWRAAIEKRWKLEYAEPNEEERTYRMV